ncbi:MAG: hypothetical protein A2X59_05935 [Nitrospirae bacterium GWC2_42_7]|nr:MAG: hypothetical protein A2X59_05935 [Nitrospirae bacterium GWC2_42_7]
MEETDLRELCRNFCHYYKPLKNEDFKCRGYLVVMELINKGKNLSFDKTDAILDEGTIRMLSKKLCLSCSFYENDCDFAAHVEKAPPCGGFIFLGHLVSEEVLKVEDMDCLKR